MHKIDNVKSNHTRALLNCLRASPLLVGHLPLLPDISEALCFDRSRFSSSVNILHLNYAQKLGHLYEDALELLLVHSPKIELLGKSIQIFDENRITLGELDYILRDCINEKHIHLELAVKFYLVRYQDGQPIYPGPDPRDNWLNKLQRLQQHQLKLTHHPAAKKLLLENYGIANIVPQQLIYGKLFDHYLAIKKPRPPGMNPYCQRGTWKYLSEWERDSSESELVVIPKHLWPVECDIDIVNTLPSISRENFILESSQRCTMIWDEVSQDSQFVAPDTWS